MRQWDQELEKLEGERPAQYCGSEVRVIEKMMRENEDDPAYVLGVFAEAVFSRVREIAEYPFDTPEARSLDEMSEDLRRLRHRWLAKYPELVEKIEARW